MADSVTSQTIIDGDRVCVMKFTNVSDGTGESAVDKVAVASLTARSRDGAPCTQVSIRRMWFWTAGMSVNMFWDASSDVLIFTAPTDREGYYDFSDFCIPNNAGSGKTGKIQFTTVGHTSGDTYTIILEMIKNY